MVAEPRGQVRSSGPDAVELAAACGLVLDPWQVGFLSSAMGEQADDSWAASEVGLIASRQNGKNGAVEARELFGLSILNEWIIHTSHLFTTTRESYDRLMGMIQFNPDVANLVTLAVASPASGYKIRFRGGGRITFIARSRSSGRGLTGDLLIFDEAQELTDDAQGALLPVISARPGSQAWYLGSAPDIGSTVFHRVRKRGRAGGDGRLAYQEFSADPESPLDDRDAWAQANPALGLRITEEAIEAERAAMSDEMFARERLSISPDLTDGLGILPGWLDVCDPDVEVGRPRLFAADVHEDRLSSGIVARGDGPTLEVVDYRQGCSWLPDRLVELTDRYKVPVALDRNGPVGSFVPELEARGVTLIELNGIDMARACGTFFDLVSGGGVQIRSSHELDTSVLNAARRPQGDQWVWTRKSSRADISLLVAATIAGTVEPPSVEPPSAMWM